MNERHFRVCKLEGKNIELGGVSISSKASPGSAARKLLTSIAHHKGLKKNKKASMPKVKYCIQEYTQGSSKKIYGPYVGHYHKYTAAELKKAETAGGKVKFTMKPVVKLAKGNMKGGDTISDFNEKYLKHDFSEKPIENFKKINFNDKNFYVLRYGKQLYEIPKDLNEFPPNFLFKSIGVIKINTEKLKKYNGEGIIKDLSDNGIIKIDCENDKIFRTKIEGVCSKLNKKNEYTGCNPLPVEMCPNNTQKGSGGKKRKNKKIKRRV